ncbi:MAG: urease accessory protein UreD [Acidimicrobiales bacterium]
MDDGRVGAGQALNLTTPPACPAAVPVPLSAGGSLNGRAHIVVEHTGEGVDRLVECWGEAPLAPRPTSRGVFLVGGAAGPLGGDSLSCQVSVGSGARLRVGSVAASYARPGVGREHSVLRVEARVEQGATLHWAPQPLVALDGCRHRSEVTIDLAPGAEVLWIDIVVMGRQGEAGGEVVSRRSVDLAGKPLSRQELRLGTSSRAMQGPAVFGGARVLGSCLVVNPEWERTGVRAGDAPGPAMRLSPGPAPGNAFAPGDGILSRSDGKPRGGNQRYGVLPLAGPAVDLVVLGQSVGEVLAAWDQLAAQLAAGAPRTADQLARYVEEYR